MPFFILCVKCKTTTVCKRISLVTGGGGHFSKTFSIFYMLNSKKQGFQPIFLNRYFSNEKNDFVDNSSVEPAIFLMEKLSFSMKLFFVHFYGQSFIKTEGALWLNGRVLDSRPKGRGFEPHWRNCVVVLEQDTFILA